MTVDQKSLLKDLQRQVRALEEDIRTRAAQSDDVADRLQREHAHAVEVGRTAVSFSEWRDTQVTQAAVAWVLGMVFVRFCEDNLLIDEAWISGPGDRRREASERETAWLLQHTDMNQRGWLMAAFDHLASHRAVAALFDAKHNPLHELSISDDAAESLIDFWRRASESGELDHDFTDPDLSTRFLGDLYQDLSEAARKQYALLQTPDFVEELILDLTLDPAIETFGLEGLRLIDPTCGSGHFLLGAFQRLFDRWGRERPGMDRRERVQAALDSVHGVDINPFATAIARFRLTVAALKASGHDRLAEAPGYDLHIATGDSLLYEQGRQGELFDSGLAEHQYESEDLSEHPDILKPGRYHAVVGNPPYITVKDKALSGVYRLAYSACHRQYALSVPFAQLFFRLAVHDYDRAGYVGQITSNSFMKREFGTKLVENFLPSIELTYVLDTSGVTIPGHGTPTVILIGRRRHALASSVRTVLGVRGEPSGKNTGAMGAVWQSIVGHLKDVGFENEYISVVDMPRDRLKSHPWSLSGGGADELMAHVDAKAARRLSQAVARIGFMAMSHADEPFTYPPEAVKRLGLRADLFPRLVPGDAVRDFQVDSEDVTWFPYGEAARLLPLDRGSAEWRLLWPLRTELGNRATFKGTYFTDGRPWWEWHQVPADRDTSELTLAFAFVATHNHFVLNRGGMVFKQTAPVVKLPRGANDHDAFGLLLLLNSSVGLFWLRNMCLGKPLSGEEWERRYEFDATKVSQFPLPAGVDGGRARRLTELAGRLQASDPCMLREKGALTSKALAEARIRSTAVRDEMVAMQEELDWYAYRLYGVVDEDFTYTGDDLPGLALGQRAFEVLMARRMQDEGTNTSLWFERHGGTPTTALPSAWPKAYRDVVQRRLDAIIASPHLRLLEKPEFKRRWMSDSWEVSEERALRGFLLDRLEEVELWRDNSGRPQPKSIAQLADLLAADSDFLSALDLWTRRSGSDVAQELSRLLADEHVPFLAALRHKEPGLRARAEWERTWELQRREDAGEKVGAIPVPPKYKPTDFARPSYWRHRGKLDVPKERFISYPGAERGADSSLVLGWAGWDHAEQALALAGLARSRAQSDGWGAAQLTPLLAGVAELEPWVRQWHGEVDQRMGNSPAQAVTAILDRELMRLNLTREDLAAWRPAPTTRGRRAATPRG